MVYVAFVLMVAIMYGIQRADAKREERSLKAVEKTHGELYELIDEYYGDTPAQAKERKAEVDMIIHEHWKEINRKYSPATLKQVTTAEERRERNRACNEGRYAEYSARKYTKAQVLDAIDEAIIDIMVDAEDPCAPTEGRERAIVRCMNRSGMSHSEAAKRIDNFIATMC